MTTDHPRFEDLSAHHDGEAPEWAAHLAGCASCQSRLGELATLTDAIARTPSGEVPRHDHDDPVTRVIATARDGAGTPFGHGAGTPFGHGAGTSFGHGAGTPFGHGAGTPFGHGAGTSFGHQGRDRRRWVLAASTAAVLAISIGVGAVVASKGPHRPMTRDALSGPATVAQPGDRPTAGGIDTSPDTVVAGGDLGAIPDRAALVARVAADVRAEEQRRPAAAPASPTPAPAQASGGPALANGASGTRPCEVEARGDPGDRGEVVYQATAEQAGMPAVVLAFRSAQGSGQITVEVRSVSDCRLLLQGAIP